MAPQASGGGVQDLINGGALQMLEAATLGLPLEVWKTRLGRMRDERSLEAVRNIYARGGLSAFWAGFTPKMIESGSKGAVLLASKEWIVDASTKFGFSPTAAGLIGGAGGGVAQVTVMGPCTFLVTAAVTGNKDVSTTQLIKNVWATKGFKGFYPGGSAIAWRQATNWASRQGITEFVRQSIIDARHGGNKKAKLTKLEEIVSGTIGGALSCWNQPFEVARIEMQARGADANAQKLSMAQVLKMIYGQYGIRGWFKGVVPRIGLSVWQTLFMVTGAKMVKEHLLLKSDQKKQ